MVYSSVFARCVYIPGIRVEGKDSKFWSHQPASRGDWAAIHWRLFNFHSLSESNIRDKGDSQMEDNRLGKHESWQRGMYI